jgi:hypothetical protein
MALLRLIGELGHDYTSKFNTYEEFCCWANITSNNKISGGKLLSSKIPMLTEYFHRITILIYIII